MTKWLDLRSRKFLVNGQGGVAGNSGSSGGHLRRNRAGSRRQQSCNPTRVDRGNSSVAAAPLHQAGNVFGRVIGEGAGGGERLCTCGYEYRRVCRGDRDGTEPGRRNSKGGGGVLGVLGGGDGRRSGGNRGSHSRGTNRSRAVGRRRPGSGGCDVLAVTAYGFTGGGKVDGVSYHDERACRAYGDSI